MAKPISGINDVRMNSTPSDPTGYPLGSEVYITEGGGCGSLGSEWSSVGGTQTSVLSKSPFGLTFDDYWQCRKTMHSGDGFAQNVKNDCCLNGYFSQQTPGWTCGPNTSGEARYSSPDCSESYKAHCTKDNIFSDEKCKLWMEKNTTGDGVINNYDIVSRIRDYCVDNMDNPNCTKLKNLRDKALYTDLMSAYCNKSGENFSKDVCRQWCVESPTTSGGASKCDAGATMFCKDKNPDPICVCENSQIQYIYDKDKKNINPICVDPKCKQPNVYVPARFGTDCPDIVDCSVRYEIGQVGGKVDINSEAEQNCGNAAAAEAAAAATETTPKESSTDSSSHTINGKSIDNSSGGISWKIILIILFVVILIILAIVAAVVIKKRRANKLYGKLNEDFDEFAEFNTSSKKYSYDNNLPKKSPKKYFNDFDDVDNTPKKYFDASSKKSSKKSPKKSKTQDNDSDEEPDDNEDLDNSDEESDEKSSDEESSDEESNK